MNIEYILCYWTYIKTESLWKYISCVLDLKFVLTLLLMLNNARYFRTTTYVSGVKDEPVSSDSIPHHSLVFAWAHRIQTSVWLHALFSGEPVEIQPFNTLLSYVPSVSSEVAAAEISPSARISSFLQLSSFCSFTRLAHIGVVQSAPWCLVARKSRRLALRLRGNGLISVFFLRPLPRPSWENSLCNLRLSFQLHVSSGQF